MTKEKEIKTETAAIKMTPTMLSEVMNHVKELDVSFSNYGRRAVMEKIKRDRGEL